MLAVHTLPAVKRIESGWEFILWLGETFDYSTPFRAALDEIVEGLARTAHSELALPQQEAFEDFIEGELTFGYAQIRIYFEHSLGYLSLGSDDRASLEDVAARIFPLVVVK